MRSALSVVVFVVLVSGCGGESAPTAPSQPASVASVSPPPVMPAAALEIVRGQVQFPSLDPVHGWTFTGEGRNSGVGCAASVKGTARFADANGATLQAIAFSLDAAQRIKPSETFMFQGCCLTEANGRASGTAAVTFEWENVTCQ